MYWKSPKSREKQWPKISTAVKDCDRLYHRWRKLYLHIRYHHTHTSSSNAVHLTKLTSHWYPEVLQSKWQIQSYTFLHPGIFLMQFSLLWSFYWISLKAKMFPRLHVSNFKKYSVLLPFQQCNWEWFFFLGTLTALIFALFMHHVACTILCHICVMPSTLQVLL